MTKSKCNNCVNKRKTWSKELIPYKRNSKGFISMNNNKAISIIKKENK